MTGKRDVRREGGSLVSDPVPGIRVQCMAPEARDMLDAAVAGWKEFNKNRERPPEDPAYSAFYWLFRYSGIIRYE